MSTLIPQASTPDQGPGHPTLAGSSARKLGAYYTPPLASQYMARWSIRRGDERVLEPSVGDGAFVAAVAREAIRHGANGADVTGVEIALDTYMGILANGVLARDKAILSDFMAVAPFPVDVAIGNPPYVRLRHLRSGEAARARAIAERVLGKPMESDGSLWMPFVLHAVEFLELGGRLAFVLPYDATYVRYARPLWQYLADNFRTLRVIRVHERVFPEILQDVILLLADGWGGSTKGIEFEAYATPTHLDADEPMRRSVVNVARVISGERAFVEALLSPDLVQLLRERILPATIEVRDRVAFNIGYVCGDKQFFHPTAECVGLHSIPDRSLINVVTSSRLARRGGLRTSGLPTTSRSRLFLPPADPDNLTEGERQYINSGATTGVSQRYKCRVRDPWYVTPDVRIPDLLLPVFADRPMLLVNDDGLAASNSLLVGFLRSGTAGAFVAAWYTTLTLLEVELRVHSLGGGVMVLIPGETGSIRIATGEVDTGRLDEVDNLLRNDQVEDAYRTGDEPVLRKTMGLSSAEVGLVADGVTALRYWRSARRRGTSVEDVPEDEAFPEGDDEAVDEAVDRHVEVRH